MRLNTRKALKAVTSPDTSITVKALKKSDAVYSRFHLHEKEASLNMLALAMVEEQFPNTKARRSSGCDEIASYDAYSCCVCLRKTLQRVV